jgi:hypothetical protein
MQTTEIGSSHGSEHVGIGLLGCNPTWICKQIPVFDRYILPPPSRSEEVTNPHGFTTQRINTDTQTTDFIINKI